VLVSFGMGIHTSRRSFPSRSAGGIQSDDSTFPKVYGVDSRFRGNDYVSQMTPIPAEAYCFPAEVAGCACWACTVCFAFTKALAASPPALDRETMGRETRKDARAPVKTPDKTGTSPPSASGKEEVRSQKSEIRSQKSEDRR